MNKDIKLNIVVKQDTQKDIKIAHVKSYYFDKQYLVVTTVDGLKQWFKTSTVLEIQES